MTRIGTIGTNPPAQAKDAQPGGHRQSSLQPPASGGTGPDVVAVITLFVLGLILALMVAPQWLEPDDDGLYLYQANALLHGAIPYRDFFLHDAPLGNAWHALLLALFGNDALVLRLALVPFKALVLPAVYLLARPLAPRGPALLAALSVPIVDNSTQYTPPHVAVNATGLAMIGVLLVARWNRSRAPASLVAAGAVLGIMTGFKQNMGLYLLGATALWLLEAGPDARPADEAGVPVAARRRAGWRVVAWGGAVVSVIWLVRAHPEPDVLVSLVVPALALALAALRPQAIPTPPGRRLLLRWIALGGGFLAGTLPWLGWVVWGAGLLAVIDGLLRVPSNVPTVWFTPLRPPDPALGWVLGLYAGGLALAAGLLLLTRTRLGRGAAPWLVWGGLAGWGTILVLFTPLLQIATTGLIYVWLYFNLLVFWPLFLAIERLEPGPQRTHARLLLLSATFLSLEMYPTLVRGHANYCFVLFLPLVAWLLWRLAAAVRRWVPAGTPGRVGAAPAVALALLPVLGFGWTLTWHVGLYVDLPATWQSGHLTPVAWVPLNLPHLHLLETPANAAMYHQIAAAVTSRTRPGEPIYCFYRQPAFYFAADRPPAIANVYGPPGTTRAEGMAVRTALAQSGVRLILANIGALQSAVPLDPSVPAETVDWYAPIRDYVRSGFHPVAAFGPWSIWERNP